jgi:hypothetical protein
MYTRMLGITALIGVLLCASGCPGTPIVTGMWLFQFSTLPGTYILNLTFPNIAIAHDNGYGELEGPTYWEAKFGKLFLEQHTQSGIYIYEGTLVDGTSAAGTFRLQNSLQVLGTWSGSLI